MKRPILKSKKDKMNKKEKKILKNKQALNRLDFNEESNCFNFQDNPTVRLINPAKNEIGRISKVIIDKINLSLMEQLKVNQWKNTQNVVKWFTEIEEKAITNS